MEAWYPYQQVVDSKNDILHTVLFDKNYNHCAASDFLRFCQYVVQWTVTVRFFSDMMRIFSLFAHTSFQIMGIWSVYVRYVLDLGLLALVGPPSPRLRSNLPGWLRGSRFVGQGGKVGLEAIACSPCCCLVSGKMLDPPTKDMVKIGLVFTDLHRGMGFWLKSYLQHQSGRQKTCRVWEPFPIFKLNSSMSEFLWICTESTRSERWTLSM